MARIQRIRPQGLVSSPAFSHVDGVDLAAAYGAIASELASDEPALVTGARVTALGVPGALVEISAVAAVLP